MSIIAQSKSKNSWRPDRYRISALSGNEKPTHIREYRTIPDALVESIGQGIETVLDAAENSVSAMKSKVKNQLASYNWSTAGPPDDMFNTWDNASYLNAGFIGTGSDLEDETEDDYRNLRQELGKLETNQCYGSD